MRLGGQSQLALKVLSSCAEQLLCNQILPCPVLQCSVLLETPELPPQQGSNLNGGTATLAFTVQALLSTHLASAIPAMSTA